MSKANRLDITLTPDDLYIMRFYKFTPSRLNRTTWTYSDEKIVEIEKIENVYYDMIQDIFTQITGMYTHL